MERREFLAIGAAAMTAVGFGHGTRAQRGDAMYGLIGKITAVPDKRDELIAILLDGTARIPGGLSYIVARDRTDPNGIWITEVWDSQASHAASLSLPPVRQAIAKGKPLIAGFGDRIETIPVGGQGLEGSPRRG